MAEALLVETKVEYETLIRFVNVLRTRDATFSEMASRIIEVSQSKLLESGMHNNATCILRVTSVNSTAVLLVSRSTCRSI